LKSPIKTYKESMAAVEELTESIQALCELLAIMLKREITWEKKV